MTVPRKLSTSNSENGSLSAVNWSSSKPNEVQLGETKEPGKSKVGARTLVLAVTAFVTAFGSSFPHGWNTGVLNNPAALVRDFLNASYVQSRGSIPADGTVHALWATCQSIYLVGGCVGACSAGYVAELLGRKRALLIFHVCNFVASVLFVLCRTTLSFEMLYAARIITGLACGAATVLVPMYLTEIAPVDIRGSMGTLHQLLVTCGILASQVAGLTQLLGTNGRWHLLLALAGVPSLLAFLVLPFLPESPRYLLLDKGDEAAAERALRIFRGTDDVTADVAEMRAESEKSEAASWTALKLLRSKQLRLQLVLVCAIAASQQLSGINVVFYYSADAFAAAGVPRNSIQYAVILTGLISVAMTAVSIPLMEKSGRRILLLGGMIVMLISEVVWITALNTQRQYPGMAYVSVASTIVFIIGFSVGLGPIPQFIAAELFKQGPRPVAASITGLFNWAFNFAVAQAFPSLQLVLTSYTMLVFFVCTALFLLFFWRKLPETKNKTYDEIGRMFNPTGNDDRKGAAEDEALVT